MTEREETMHVLTNIAGDELGCYAGTLAEATEWARKRLEDDPEAGTLELYSVRGEGWTHVKTITHAPDAHWNSEVVVLAPDEKIQPPSGAYLPRRITEEDFEGYDLNDPKRIGIERMIGTWI